MDIGREIETLIVEPHAVPDPLRAPAFDIPVPQETTTSAPDREREREREKVSTSN